MAWVWKFPRFRLLETYQDQFQTEIFLAHHASRLPHTSHAMCRTHLIIASSNLVMVLVYGGLLPCDLAYGRLILVPDRSPTASGNRLLVRNIHSQFICRLLSSITS